MPNVNSTSLVQIKTRSIASLRLLVWQCGAAVLLVALFVAPGIDAEAKSAATQAQQTRNDESDNENLRLEARRLVARAQDFRLRQTRMKQESDLSPAAERDRAALLRQRQSEAEVFERQRQVYVSHYRAPDSLLEAAHELQDEREAARAAEQHEHLRRQYVLGQRRLERVRQGPGKIDDYAEMGGSIRAPLKVPIVKNSDSDSEMLQDQ